VEVAVEVWRVGYPYDAEGAAAFRSSNATLDAVWALCEATLRATSLDAFTDSNTRERLPYEADGLITGASWAVLQREYNLPRLTTLHNFKVGWWARREGQQKRGGGERPTACWQWGERHAPPPPLRSPN